MDGHGVLTVVTQNCWLIPMREGSPPTIDYKVAGRAARVARKLLELGEARSVDVFFLQEVWSFPRSPLGCLAALVSCLACACRKAVGSRRVRDSLSGAYCLSRPAMAGWGVARPFCATMMDSGLVIASATPILLERFVAFRAAFKEDALACKGVLFCLVQKAGLPVILANTHLQACAGPEADAVRRLQVDELVAALAAFAAACRRLPEVPEGAALHAVVGGDWNINGAGGVEDYAHLQQALARADCLHSRPGSGGPCLLDSWARRAPRPGSRSPAFVGGGGPPDPAAFRELGITYLEKAKPRLEGSPQGPPLAQRLDMLFSDLPPADALSLAAERAAQLGHFYEDGSEMDSYNISDHGAYCVQFRLPEG